jgi:hypothetical protein
MATLGVANGGGKKMCCGETPCPDQSSVKVLYADQLAPDDFMWSVSCTTTDLADFLLEPQNWVRCLAQLPDWKAPGKVPILLNPFNITLSERVLQEDDGSVLIEGISETAIVRVVLTEQSGLNAARVLTHVGSESWSLHPKVKSLRKALNTPVEPTWMIEYWEMVTDVLAADGVHPDLIRDMDNLTWFGHLRVFDERWSEIPGFRSEWLTAFLVMRLIDPAGYIRTLNALGPILQDDTQVAAGEESVVIVGSPNIMFSYNSMNPSNQEACDAIFGGFNSQTPTQMVVQDGIVKSYATPVPPPVPPQGSDREAHLVESR